MGDEKNPVITEETVMAVLVEALRAGDAELVAFAADWAHAYVGRAQVLPAMPAGWPSRLRNREAVRAGCDFLSALAERTAAPRKGG